MHPARDLGGQERLGRIVDVLRRSERLRHLGASRPEVLFVDDKQWGAVCLGQLGDRDAADLRHTVLTATGALRVDRLRQLREFLWRIGPFGQVRCRHDLRVPWSGGVCVHIRSGALTPTIAKPLAMTCWVAPHRANRAAWRSVGSSSP